MPGTHHHSLTGRLLQVSFLGLSLVSLGLAQNARPQDILFTSEFTGEFDNEDQLGVAVAASDTHLCVGAMAWGPDLGPSAVLMHELTPAGWRLSQVLRPGDGEGGSGYGSTVEISGNTVAFGALQHGFFTGLSGRVYIYEHSGTTWTETASFGPPLGAGTNPAFGRRIAMDEDRILVTAFGSGSGAVYVYERGPSGWALQDTLRSPDGQGSFGRDVALDGDTAVVSISNTPIPRLYFFKQSTGSWALTDLLEIPDSISGGVVGAAIDLEGETLIVGQPSSSTHPGRVLVYEQAGGQWIQTQVLMASDAQFSPFGESFGVCLDLRGDRLLIGAPQAVEPEGTGSAYLFERINGTWVETQKLGSSTPSVAGYVGWSVALTRSMALVGAPVHGVANIVPGAALGYWLPLGETICDGEINSTGLYAELTVTGSQLAQFEYLSAKASDLPTNQPVQFFASLSSTHLPGAGGGAGTLCLGSPLLPLHPVQTTASDGKAQVPVQLAGLASLAGQNLHLQAWYRDPAGLHNLTSAVCLPLE